MRWERIRQLARERQIHRLLSWLKLLKHERCKPQHQHNHRSRNPQRLYHDHGVGLVLNLSEVLVGSRHYGPAGSSAHVFGNQNDNEIKVQGDLARQIKWRSKLHETDMAGPANIYMGHNAVMAVSHCIWGKKSKI